MVDDETKKTRIMYFIGGAAVGGIVGYLLGYPFEVSAVGMLGATIAASRAEA